MSTYQRLGCTREILSCLAPNGLPWCIAEVLTIAPDTEGRGYDTLLKTETRVFPMKQSDGVYGYVVDGMGLDHVAGHPRPPRIPLPPEAP